MLLASVFLFSGCSLWADKNQTMSLEDARKMAQENPSELLYTLAKANGEEKLETMKKYFPSKETLQRYTSSYHEKMSFDLLNTPLGGGKGTYETNISSEGDYKDLQNPQQKTEITSVADIMGGMIGWDVKAVISVVEKSIFVSIEKANINAMMMPPEVKTTLASLAGKTFGNTWEEIKTLSNGEFDFAKYFTSGGILMNILQFSEDAAHNPKDFVTFQKFIKEENGYFYFEVVPSKAGTEKAMNMVKNIFPFGKTFEAEMQSAIENSMKEQANTPSIIAYNPLNKKYFIQEIQVADKMTMTISFLENETSWKMIDKTSEPNETIEVSKKNETVVGNIIENGSTKAFLQGTITDEKIALSFLNPENNTIVGILSLQKSSKGWSGEMSSDELAKMKPSLAGVKLMFTNLTASPEGFSGEFDIMMNAASVVKMQSEYSIKKASGSVNVKKPENALPFSEIMKTLENLPASLIESEETEDLQALPQ